MISFAKIKSMLFDVNSTDKELTHKIETAVQKKNDLLAAPVSKEDYVRHYTNTVDLMGQRYLLSVENLRRQDAMRPAMDFAGTENFCRLFNPNGADTSRIDPAALCFLFGDLIKKQFSVAVEKLSWTAGDSPALSDRMKMVADLDKLISALSTERAALRQEAARNGVILGGSAIDETKLSKSQRIALDALKKSAEQEAADG